MAILFLPILSTLIFSVSSELPSLESPLTPYTHPTCLSTANNLDIIFLIDTSCGLSPTECTKMQHGVSTLISTIKHAAEPRVAYIEWSDPFHQFPFITLDDPQWNNYANDHSFIQQEYTNFVSNISCFNATYPTDVATALSFARSHFQVYETELQVSRKKRIVLINNCVHDVAHDPCDAVHNGDLFVHDAEIKVIVVNINDVNNSDIRYPQSYLSCLVKDDPQRLFAITELKASAFEDILDAFANEVCEVDDIMEGEEGTGAPTVSPTEIIRIIRDDGMDEGDHGLDFGDKQVGIQKVYEFDEFSVITVGVVAVLVIICLLLFCVCWICINKRRKRMEDDDDDDKVSNDTTV